MRFTWWRRFLPGLMICGLLAPGCQGRDPSLPELHPVTGRVTLDNKPLVEAGLIFIPYGSTRGSGSQALTDRDGNYVLMTQMTDEPGAAEGEHQVLISKLSGTPGVAETGASETLPARYSNPQSLELKANVQPGKNVFNFDLTSKK